MKKSRPKARVKPILDGYRAVISYIVAEGADKLIEFLKNAFGAEESERLERPDGKIGHAEVRIGDSVVMIGEAGDTCKASSAILYVYVKDADAVYKRALKAGGASVMKPTDMFWGDRYGAVMDRSGNTWGIATHVEDVPPKELKTRAAAFFAQQPPAR